MKGAVIASDATPDKNKISTDTLTYSDIQNEAEYEASSTGVSLDVIDGKIGMPKVTPGMPVSGDADSTTKSAISSGDIVVRSNPDTDLSKISHDTENASQTLAKIFDKKSVEEQQELAKVFGEEAYKLVGDISQKYQKEKFNTDVDAITLELEAKKAEENGNVEEANKLREKAAQLKTRSEELSIWDEGGKAKIALHALVGGVMSTMGSGSYGSGALSAGINESLQDEISKLPPELRSLGSAVIGTAVSEAVGGDGQSGAAITTSAAENNFGLHKLLDELKNIAFGSLVDYGASWITGEEFDLMQSILANSSYNDIVQVSAKIKSGDHIGALEHSIALGASVGVGKNVEKLNQLAEKVRKYKGSNKAVFNAGKTTIEDIAANPKALSGKSAEEVAQMLREAGYDVTVQASKKSTSGAQIIKINNPGEGRNITQVQVSPGGGRHGANPYVKISTSDQGIIKVVDGAEEIYKTDGAETAKIIFTGGK